MATDTKTTTDHDEIRRWAEAHDGQPAQVRGTAGDQEAGVLRLDFSGGAGEDDLEPISWDEWFEKFDDSGLAFLYQERKADGSDDATRSEQDRAEERAEEVASEVAEDNPDPVTRREAIEQALQEEDLSDEGAELGDQID